MSNSRALFVGLKCYFPLQLTEPCGCVTLVSGWGSSNSRAGSGPCVCSVDVPLLHLKAPTVPPRAPAYSVTQPAAEVIISGSGLPAVGAQTSPADPDWVGTILPGWGGLGVPLIYFSDYIPKVSLWSVTFSSNSPAVKPSSLHTLRLGHCAFHCSRLSVEIFHRNFSLELQ